MYFFFFLYWPSSYIPPTSDCVCRIHFSRRNIDQTQLRQDVSLKGGGLSRKRGPLEKINEARPVFFPTAYVFVSVGEIETS